jgi:hypothetical protein
VATEDDLEKLKFYFIRGENTYNEYLLHGQTFLYAKILRENNRGLLNHLIELYPKLPSTLQSDALSLIHHIDVWAALWDCHQNELNPKAGDKFAFENKVNYPKRAEEYIVQYLETLTND